MARHPLVFAIIASLVCALAGTGFIRFTADSGSALLVGRNSQAGQVNDRFTKDFGSDPIVVVLTAQNPSALYTESNITRLAALELDLAKDSRVAAVLGPGTVAAAALQGVKNQINSTTAEFGRFVGNLALISYQRANPNVDFNHLTADQQTLLSNTENQAESAGQAALAAQVLSAAAAAQSARTSFAQNHPTTAKIIDGQEVAADQAAAKVALPQFFSAYINAKLGRNLDASDQDARNLFARFSAAYGVCDQNIASFMKVSADCQAFLWRFLLDLPNCPAISSNTFCTPKSQWAATLPAPAPGGPSRAIITVRLTANAAKDHNAAADVVAKLRSEFSNGLPNSTQQSTGTPTTTIQGPLLPTECNGIADTSGACDRAFHNAPFSYTIAGAPLLTAGVTTVTTHLLLALFPVALLVMLVLLVGTFGARGRVWPLLAAAFAALLTLGVTMLLGVSVTPAVLAGVPVLVGLGVDYAVQMVARFAEERRNGLGIEASLRQVLRNTGPATLAAAGATVAGLASLGVIAGVDAGSVLVAVPLVAEFALVLVGGVIVAWLAALFIALPAAAAQDKRREQLGLVAPDTVSETAPPPAQRTTALASRWQVVLVPAALLAIAGWALTPRVPVQTDVEKLLAPSLNELKDIQTVRAQTGYTNELDIYLEGAPVGPSNTNPPDNVLWQRRATQEISACHPDAVAQATSIGDALLGPLTGKCDQTGTITLPPSPSPTPAPSTSPTSAASPGTSPAPSSPSSSPTPASSKLDGDIVRVANGRPAFAADTSPTAASSAAATPAGTPAATGTPAASATPLASVPPVSATPVVPAQPQTDFICELRTVPALARSLVGGFSTNTPPCPAVDVVNHVYMNVTASNPDPGAVNPVSARIALGVRTTSGADEANLVHQLRNELAGHPSSLTSVEPAGIAALGVSAYDTITSRGLFLNLLPLLVVAVALVLIYREPRRALLPVLPTALAAGWAPLLILVLGKLPGAGDTLGSLNPLTVVLGALVVALGTEFGVVLLHRFYEERARGLDPDEAAAAALHGVGRSILVSAATLGAGFAVLAISGLFPAGLPLIADFGLAVLIDLGLAVLAVFAVMLPVAVAIERVAPAPFVAAPAAEFRRLEPARGAAGRAAKGRRRAVEPLPQRTRPVAVAVAEPEVEEVESEEVELEEAEFDEEGVELDETEFDEEAEEVPAYEEDVPVATGDEVESAVEPSPAPAARRLPGMSGRRRPATPVASPPPLELPRAPSARLPGVSGRRRATGQSPPPPLDVTPPPLSIPNTAPPPEPRPRRPGSFIPRRQPATEPPVRAATPPQPPPPSPEPPAAAAPPPPSDSPPAPPAPPPDRGPGVPGEPRRKSRRRRPPPHLRRRDN
jgi:predicted RND superfamily exporter protein